MKKQDVSSLTKKSILDAASTIILEKGAEALTLEAVALQAGMSKGGLLYHFSSKRKLIEGMIDRLISETQNEIEKKMQENGGKFLQAYIDITICPHPLYQKLSCALFAAIANEPDLIHPLQFCFQVWQERIAADAPSPEIGTLIRLAMDGLWLSELFDFAPPPPMLREKMVEVIHSIIIQQNDTDENLR
jgi:AcrR family transcriptional regulator